MLAHSVSRAATSQRLARRLAPLACRRTFSSQEAQQAPREAAAAAAKLEVKPEVRQRNAITALLLLGFVGGVYYTAISKMKEKDDLSDAIESEMKQQQQTSKKA